MDRSLSVIPEPREFQDARPYVGCRGISLGPALLYEFHGVLGGVSLCDQYRGCHGYTAVAAPRAMGQDAAASTDVEPERLVIPGR